MSHPPTPTRRWSRGRLLLLGAGVGALLLHASAYRHFLSDDALISLRYARRLLQGFGLTWTAGPPVEGYSNLAWILAVAGLGATGVDLIVAARALGLAAAVGALVATLAACGRPRAPLLPAAFAVGGLTLSAPLVAWIPGALEQPLLVALLAWALALLLPRGSAPGAPACARLRAAGLLLGLLCLTRPDGVVLAAGTMAGAALAWGRGPGRWSRLAVLGALPAAAVAGQGLFRVLYYGDWLPNAAYVKLGLSWKRLGEGLEYLGMGLASLPGLALPALVAVGLALRGADRRPRVVALLMPLAFWSAYVVAIGGDIFPARRHLAPVALLLAWLGAETWGTLLKGARTASAGSRRGRVVAAGVVACLLLQGAAQALDPENRRATAERWAWDGDPVGRMLAAAFGAQQPLVAVDPAGCIPYFSGLPALDMLGLNDRAIARRRHPDAGSGWIGHEAGDGAYVLSRRPDLVVFCQPTGSARACFRSGVEMFREPAFRRAYRLIVFQTAGASPLQAQIWVRADSERIGIRKLADQVTIPGYLAAGRGVVAKLEDEVVLAAGSVSPVLAAPADDVASLVAVAAGGTLLRLPRARLDAGRWGWEVDSADPVAASHVQHAETGALLGSGARTGELQMHASADVVFSVEPGHAPFHLRAIHLRRRAGH